jgi:biofilm protein TabA
MKHLSAYKNLCLLIVFIMIKGVCIGQTTSTEWNEENATKWFKEKVWASGVKAKAFPPLNVMTFAKQYEANKATWDKAISFLRDRNLELIAPGRYEIDGENAYAMVTEGPAKEIDSAAWEGHRKYIDLHYVIKGRERIGIVGNDSLKVTKPYDVTKDAENYYYADGKFYLATPEIFFLFFPGDAHQPGIRVGGNQPVKKLVIKIKVVQ